MTFWRAVSTAVLFGLALYVFLLTASPASEFKEEHLISTKEIPQLGLGTWLSDKDKVRIAADREK